MACRSGFSSRMRSKNSPLRPSRIEYVMASRTPASVNSGIVTAGRGGADATTGAGRRCSLAAGGIERAGSITAARAGATCLVGRGDGIGVRRTGIEGDAPCVARAGVVARARVTSPFDSFASAVLRGFGLLLLWRDVVRALLLTLLCDAAAF